MRPTPARYLLEVNSRGISGSRHSGAERSLRGVAVGRKNWMFYGSDQGGRTAAVLTSLIATCKRLHIDPFTYLRDIFERISSHPKKRLGELLPDGWLAHGGGKLLTFLEGRL